jgi:hypothetical protein
VTKHVGDRKVVRQIDTFMRPARWLPLIILCCVPAGAWLAGWFRDSAVQVVDANGPVAQVRVRFRGEGATSTTDARGHFSLPTSRQRPGRISLAREGYLIESFPVPGLPGSLRLSPIPSDDESYCWVEPGPTPAGANTCVHCHRQIYEEWLPSAHARSATNRHFLNLYDGGDWHGRRQVSWNLRADNPEGAGVCAACHAPTVSARGPAFEDIRKARGVDRRGVHCDFCHKVSDATADERGLTFGRFGYKLTRPARGQLFFGPLDDAERDGESFSYSPLYRQSRYCASCHEGVVFGVPVYTTYSEWLASPARREGKECQSCHMAPSGRLINIAPGKGGIERDPSTLATHGFPGSQAEMLRRCLAVEAHLTREAGRVVVQVQIRADYVGHRVPTGFIDRNLILVVEALDRQGKPVPLQKGPTLPALAGHALAGKPGRLYAKQLLDNSGQAPIPFWRPHDKLLDTRLQPGQSDRLEFVFPKEAERVRARLIYRRFWEEVSQAKGWPDNEIIVGERSTD